MDRTFRLLRLEVAMAALVSALIGVYAAAWLMVAVWWMVLVG